MSEDGEIDTEGYDPALEWPGDECCDSIHSTQVAQRVAFRLVVTASACLKTGQRLVILDAASLNHASILSGEIHLGRDAPSSGQAHIPRIRLKELPVSKHHATVYWDHFDNYPKLIDTGSKHGTFLNGHRLSPERNASLPHKLAHGDEFELGTTTFQVHLHHEAIACDVCSELVGEVLIPLNHTPRQHSNPSKGRNDALGEVSFTPRRQFSTRQALNDLKRDLLARHPDLPSPGTVYHDRSAKRRALHPASSADAPGIRPTSALSSSPPPELPTPPPTSAPAVPLASTNIGFKLLMKQGWIPGTGISQVTDEGESIEGRLDPIESRENRQRAGLGMISHLKNSRHR